MNHSVSTKVSTTMNLESIIEDLEQFYQQMKPDYEMMVDFVESQGITITPKIEDIIFTILEYDLNPMTDEDGVLW